ncbi:MAG: methyl-accepting chemotaxis protein [Eubacterium sp.]|nr:methyl-accepting chemotaxis protein [Eubacterium sp.]
MKTKKRRSLKKVLLTEIIVFVAVIIAIITAISVKLQKDEIRDLTRSVLSEESISYSSEIYNWWSSIEQRVAQTASVFKNIPEPNYDDTLKMLLALTESDPDSQDIYIAYGDDNKFLDGSGWTPDADFVFTDRAWYQGAMEKNGEIYTSEPYLDASTGKTCLACSVMLRDKVVLSSDIVFDKVAEKLNGFKSSSEDAKYYIVNKETGDILVSNVSEVVGQKLGESADAIVTGMNEVFDSLNTESTVGVDKVEMTGTGEGNMMYVGTDIADTSWVVVTAVPNSFIMNKVMRMMFITLGIAIGLMILLAIALYIVINKYINPVSKVTERITDISGGDFTVNLKPEGNNEITTLSESLNTYIGGMHDMLTNLAEISSNMNENAGKCFDISQALSTSNHTQGESIEKLNTTLSAMSSSIDDVAQAATDLAATSGDLMNSAENVRDLCNESLESSRAGKAEMDIMTGNVKTLDETIRELTDIIKVTAKSVEEITGITDTINAISEQTNLLSLNASIEAARAGESGKGFAVVASEVGALAKQSTEATETIRSLIGSITKNIEDINRNADTCITDMEACITGVENANKSFDLIYTDVEKAARGMTDITNGITRINDVASGNAATSEEQAAAINEVLGLSEQIVSESDNIVSETESISGISESLNRYSDEINEDLSQYRL